MPSFTSRALQTVLCGLLLGVSALAQETSGEAEVGLQQYYLAIEAHRVANISGLGIHFNEFIPNVGLVSGSLLPAASNDRFRTGDSYLQLKGLPWRGRHWTFTAGDFHLSGQLLPFLFSNVNFPEISARGGALEATHGSGTFGFFFGEATISNTPRVVLRQQIPQTLIGAYWRQGFGTRLLLGARFMRFSNDLVALRKLPGLVAQTPLKDATILSVDSLFTVIGPLKVYGEATWSAASRSGPDLGTRSVPVSTLAGPILDTKVFTLQANYTLQNAAYFPVLGYYMGDREGPFAEVKFRPWERIEIYSSASKFQNNVARDPSLATFRNTSESAGASIQLPGKISVNAQLTKLDLSTRTNDASPWLRSADRQESFSLARPVRRHHIRFTLRDFEDHSPLNSQRQRSAEVEDNFHLRGLNLGGGVRLQRLSLSDSRTSLFYRGSAQFQLGRLSAYANFETGNDLQNRTLLARNTVSTTVVGVSSSRRAWDFQAEAYRNNLLTQLNPQSIFVLQGQGVLIPGTLAALNQWSMYFRLSKRFQWGTARSGADLAQYALGRAPLKGAVEGFVMERSPDGDQPAEGVTLSMDEVRTVLTDADGHFRFSEVPEGRHRVSLAPHELPAEFESGKVAQNDLAVLPNRLSRSDFDVVRLNSVRGTLSAPKDVGAESVIIRSLPGDRYTTPDADGNFVFYNLRPGTYTFSVDSTTLPEFAVLNQPGEVSVHIGTASGPPPLSFGFEIHKPVKPTRKVLDK